MIFSSSPLTSNRKFGFFFFGVFSIATVYFLYRQLDSIAWITASLAAILLSTTLVRPQLLKPLNQLWMGLGLVLVMIVSPIILGILFFLVFAPIGLLMRLFGRDELRLKNSSRDSHWKIRTLNTIPPELFKNQY